MNFTVENLQEKIYTCYFSRKFTDENLQHNQLKTDSNTQKLLGPQGRKTLVSIE